MMATTWKTILEDVDDKTDCMVNGYVRQSEELLNEDESTIIPPLIIYTILMYYWITKEYFDIINEDHVSLSKDKLTLRFIGQGWHNSNFGKVKIHSTSDVICKWKFKCHGPDGGWNVLFGITTGNDKHQVFVWDKKAKFHGVNGYTGHSYHSTEKGKHESRQYGCSFSGGDAVEMILDLSKKQLSFVLNDEDQGIAADDVKREDDLEYRAVVSFCTQGTSVELISFEIQYL